MEFIGGLCTVIRCQVWLGCPGAHPQGPVSQSERVQTLQKDVRYLNILGAQQRLGCCLARETVAIRKYYLDWVVPLLVLIQMISDDIISPSTSQPSIASIALYLILPYCEVTAVQLCRQAD
jgi:hypothetical protein